ncbi:hypothetical protein [Acidisoma silvae]|uniref:Glycine zipper domain-containing protein n=1 Tax=Acidisoma silvae TaxID=2802396 RepID=A0A963YND5_9PROT|nr:hypothetical protein [Acidisoma silvae]MCB8873699.1 hypothetical protein [Acidisoma silvae]
MTRKLTISSSLALVAVSFLTACGSSNPGRTSGGVATGAGTGAAIGIIGGPIGIVIGAAVGAGAGALTATNTTPQQVNLGDPLWARSHPAPAVPSSMPVAGGNAYSGMAAPQPLSSGGPEPYPAGQQGYGQPSPGAQPLPQSGPIQSQSLAAPGAGQPTQLSP